MAIPWAINEGVFNPLAIATCGHFLDVHDAWFVYIGILFSLAGLGAWHIRAKFKLVDVTLLLEVMLYATVWYFVGLPLLNSVCVPPAQAPLILNAGSLWVIGWQFVCIGAMLPWILRASRQRRQTLSTETSA